MNDEQNRRRQLAELPTCWQIIREQTHDEITRDPYTRKEERRGAYDDFLLDLWGRVQPGAR